MSTGALDELLREPWPHRSPAPEVRLIAHFEAPFDGAIAAARTCYSPRGVITPADVAPTAAADPDEAAARAAKRDSLAQDLYRAGHHTVFQHAHFTFSLANLSRQFVWSFLHSHPFYNSEQVSQRFVRVRGGAFAPRLDTAAAAAYDAALEASFRAYDELREALVPVVAEAFYDRFPGRRAQPDVWKSAIVKRSQEIARYVLPLATFTYLHHTISGIVLMRYLRLANAPDTPAEQRYVVARMVEALLRVAPGYRAVLEPPLEAAAFAPATEPEPWRDPDALGPHEFTRLVAYQPDAEAIAARALSQISGRAYTPEAAIDALMNPAANPLLGENLNLSYHDKRLRALQHIHYTFQKRLSHTADSQDQRHRMTPGARPELTAHLGSEPDVVVPPLVAAQPQLKRRFEDIVAAQWQTLNALRAHGVAPEWLQYLLPNAVAVRFTESADLLALMHKHRMRQCYNAQEEIWRATIEEATAIAAVHPHIGRWLLPPCSARAHAGTRPICPEGSRFCGVPVWRLERSAYVRTI